MATLPAGYGRSTISNYVTTLTSIVVALVTVPLLTRGLGQEAYGVWVLVGATVLYLELLEFGFGATTIQYVCRPGACDDPGVRTAVATSFWLLAVPGGVALVLGLALAAGFPRLFDVAPELVGPTRVLLLLLRSTSRSRSRATASAARSSPCSATTCSTPRSSRYRSSRPWAGRS